MFLQFFVTTNTTGRIEVTERVQKYQFDSLSDAGWWTARIVMNAPRRDLWLLVDGWPGGELEVFGASQTIWRGDLSGVRLDGVKLSLSANGPARSQLTGEELWRIFGDPEYNRWDPQEADDGFETDNNNRVWCAARDGVTFTSGDEASVKYPEATAELGADIERVLAHVELTITSGSWIAEIRDDVSGVLWSSTSPVSTDVDLAVSSATELEAALRATATGTGEATFRLTEVIVRTIDPAESSDVVEDLLDDAGIAHQVEASGVDVARAVYQGKRDHALRAIRDMAGLGDGSTAWLFVIYDNFEGDPVAQFRPWADDDDPAWMMDPEDLIGEVEWKLEGVFNAVRAELPDGWRSAWVTDTASIAKFGRREKTLSLPRTTQAEAELKADVFLEDNAWPIAGLRLETRALCKRPDRTVYPAWMMRGGDVLILRDLIPERDVVVRIAEIDVRERGIRIVPGGVDDRLETVIAELDEQMAQDAAIAADRAVGAGGAAGGGAVVYGAHGDLTDMPDTPGTNTDHDPRYVVHVGTGAPSTPSTPYTGQLWWDTS